MQVLLSIIFLEEVNQPLADKKTKRTIL